MPDWMENYIPEPNSGCWLWLGARNRQGYGVVYPCGRIGKQHRVHRLFYELYCGPILNGLHALHQCDNPICCNPDHIFLGTPKDNASDRVRKGRSYDQSGEKSNNVKLTKTQVSEIRISMENQTVLSIKYGVSQSQISRIKTGKRWSSASKISYTTC